MSDDFTRASLTCYQPSRYPTNTQRTAVVAVGAGAMGRWPGRAARLLSCSPRLEIYSLNPLSSCSASLPRNTSPTHDAAVSEGGAWLGLVIRRLVRCPPCPSKLTPFGQLDKLVISQLGLLAQRRLARGVKLNHAEATVGVVLSRPDCPSLTICRL